MNPTPLPTRLGYLPAVLLVLSALALSLALVRPAGAQAGCGITVNSATGLREAIAGSKAVICISTQAPVLDLGTASLAIARDNITIDGQGATIDARGVNGYGIFWTGNNVTVENLTLLGPTADTGGRYGFKIQPATAADGPITDVTLRNVTVTGSGGSEVDLHWATNVLLDRVTANGANETSDVTQGVGIAMTSTTDVTLIDVTTLNNGWGGVGFYADPSTSFASADPAPPAGSGLTITNLDADEPNPLYGEGENGGLIPGLVAPQFTHTVRNPDHRDTGEEFTFYQASESGAVALALALPEPQSSTVRLGTDGDFLVRANGSESMSIQAAVDAAEEGETIEVGDGEFAPFATSYGGPEDITIRAAEGASPIITGIPTPTTRVIDLRADGTTLTGFTVEVPDGGHVGISMSGNSVAVVENTVIADDPQTSTGTRTGIQTTTADSSGMSLIRDNNIVGTTHGISLQSAGNTVTGNYVSASTEALGVLVSGNVITGNAFLVSAGGDLAVAYGGVVIAENNWWGSNSGPAADAIVGDVDTDPYLTPEITSITVTPPSPVSSATTSVTVLVGFANSTGVTHTVSSNASNLVDGVNVITVTSTLTVAGQTYTDTETAQVTRLAAATPTPTPSPSPTTPPVTVQEPGGVSVELENEETAPVSQTSSTTVSTTSEDGAGLTVTVPAGALPAGIPAGSQLLVAAVSNPDEVSASAPPPAGADVVAHFLVDVVDPQGRALNGEFNEPVTLTFSLPAGSVAPGASGDAVVLAYWNGSEWVEVEATVTVHPNGSVTLSAQVTHFTLFSAFQAPASWGTFKPVAVQRGLTITTWMGGSYSRLVEHLQTGNSLWTSKGGTFIGYIHGAPDWVNKTFFDTYPEGLPLETPVIIAKR